MAIDIEKIINDKNHSTFLKKLTEKYKNPSNILPAYEFLLNNRSEITHELYCFCFRKLLKMATNEVSKEIRIKMFENVQREDIMTQEELDKFNSFEEQITIYRGTNLDEVSPGLSWSLDRYTAEDFDYWKGKLFIAKVHKNEILAYFTDENEVIAIINKDYTSIQE